MLLCAPWSVNVPSLQWDQPPRLSCDGQLCLSVRGKASLRKLPLSASSQDWCRQLNDRAWSTQRRAMEWTVMCHYPGMCPSIQATQLELLRLLLINPKGKQWLEKEISRKGRRTYKAPQMVTCSFWQRWLAEGFEPHLSSQLVRLLYKARIKGWVSNKVYVQRKEALRALTLTRFQSQVRDSSQSGLQVWEQVYGRASHDSRTRCARLRHLMSQ